MWPSEQQQSADASLLPGHVFEHLEEHSAHDSNSQSQTNSSKSLAYTTGAVSDSCIPSNALMNQTSVNSESPGAATALGLVLQDASSAVAAWHGAHMTADTSRSTTPHAAQLHHRNLTSLLAAAAHASSQAAHLAATTTSHTVEPLSADSQQERINILPGAMIQCTRVSHSDNCSLLNQQDPDNPLIPNLSGIKTNPPWSGSGAAVNKECCHCGKTVEKQWRKYTTIPQDDTRPLCNRCFMWRRNHGGSTTFNQDILPGPEILLAANTPRVKGPGGLFCRKSKSNNSTGMCRGRSSSGGGYSSASQPQSPHATPDTAGFYQTYTGTYADLTAAGTLLAATAFGDATTAESTATGRGNSMYEFWSCEQSHAALSRSQDGMAHSRGTAQILPGGLLQQSLGQTNAHSPRSAVTAAHSAPHSLYSSPILKQRSSSHSPLAIRRPLSKSPLSRTSTRRATYDSNPRTPSHQPQLSGLCSYEPWQHEALQEPQQRRIGVSHRSSRPPVRSSISSGHAPAASISRCPAFNGSTRNAYWYNAAECDAEVAQAAEVLANLLLLQAGPASASTADDMDCWEEDTQATALASVATAGAGTLDEDRLTGPDTPMYGFAGQTDVGSTSNGLADLVQAVEALPWMLPKPTAGSAADYDSAGKDPQCATRESELHPNADTCAAAAAPQCAADRILSRDGQALTAILGQDLCNALTAASAGCLAAAADATRVQLPVKPEVIQAFTAAMLAGVPVETLRLSNIQASHDAMQQQLKSSHEMQLLFENIMQFD